MAKKEKKTEQAESVKDTTEQTQQEVQTQEARAQAEQTENAQKPEESKVYTEEEYQALVDQNVQLQKSADQYKDQYQRLLAEFDNYKKRTIKERDANQLDAKISVIAKLLPVLDNIERAEESLAKENNLDTLKQGVEMVFRQMKDVMDSEEVEYIEAKGEEFNPELHNAVMHVEDDTCDINVVVEEFQKGYQCKGKVIRHSMVKVAN